MGEPLVLPLDADAATLDTVGGKGASLARLARAGLSVPPGFHLTTHAYHRFVAENNLQAAIVAAASAAAPEEPASLDRASAHIHDLFSAASVPDDVATALRDAYSHLESDEDDQAPAVAVRSSATAEDLADQSFAGQQDTFLNIRGQDDVLAAVQRVWASLWSARAIGYRARNAIPSESVALAVVVQRLVAADAAGVMFTANPLSGARDEVMINATWGLGEALVGGLVSPDTLVVDKSSGRIVSQAIADKDLMTVRVPGGTQEQPVSPDRRRQAVLTAEQAAALARIGAQIERLYERPMDIEWAMQSGSLFILQARPITALAESATPQAPILEWRLPRRGGQYARSSAIELLPDPLSPLFATLGLRAWNTAMSTIVGDLGLGGLMPQEGLVTINDYAYYDFGLDARQSARLVLRLPRLIGAANRLFRSAAERWEQYARPRYLDVVRRLDAVDAASLSAASLVQAAADITHAAAEHYLAIQSGILPAAYLSEAVFTQVYERFIRRPGDPPALTFLLGFPSAPLRAEQSLYDLAMWLRGQPDPTAALAGPEFQQRFAAHLAEFGHAIYDLDFANPVPAEEPRPLLDALKFFVDGTSRNPYERLRAAAAARDNATRQTLGRLRGVRLRMFRAWLRRAQRFAPLREDALSDVGLGWPRLRSLLLELGRRLVTAGAIASADDVFWLLHDELRAVATALDARQPPHDFRDVVARRHERWRGERLVTPPVALPVKGGATLAGIDFSRFMPARTEQAAGNVLQGIGASPGRVTALACVIHGPREFADMQPGGVLVARITTPAWTPLFALAAAVVTDVGGPLSHSSIVAREYHIPAVLGTGLATSRLTSRQRITVDGDAGAVTIHG